MSLARPALLQRARLGLIGITLVSFATADYLGRRDVAVAAVLSIAAIKVTIILRRFMDLGSAPAGGSRRP